MEPPANNEKQWQTQGVLHRSEDHFQLLVQGLKDYAIFMVDPQGRVITWNSGAEHIKDYREEEILGQNFSVFYTDNYVQQDHPEKELHVADNEGCCEEEGIRVWKDGSRFQAAVSITALNDEVDDFRGFLKVTNAG